MKIHRVSKLIVDRLILRMDLKRWRWRINSTTADRAALGARHLFTRNGGESVFGGQVSR